MKTIAEYLGIPRAETENVTLSFIETDQQGRSVHLWTCTGCPATVRTLDADPGTATAFIARYVSHASECATRS